MFGTVHNNSGCVNAVDDIVLIKVQVSIWLLPKFCISHAAGDHPGCNYSMWFGVCATVTRGAVGHVLIFFVELEDEVPAPTSRKT